MAQWEMAADNGILPIGLVVVGRPFGNVQPGGDGRRRVAVTMALQINAPAKCRTFDPRAFSLILKRRAFPLPPRPAPSAAAPCSFLGQQPLRDSCRVNILFDRGRGGVLENA